MLCVGAIEAQIRFKPVDKIEYELWEKEVLPTYFRDNAQCKCQFIVSPSFFPSYALYISDYTYENAKHLLINTQTFFQQRIVREKCTRWRAIAFLSSNYIH